MGSGLLATAGEAFTQAMGAGLVVAAGLAALAAVVVARFLPERESRPEARAGADDVRLAANAQRSA